MKIGAFGFGRRTSRQVKSRPGEDQCLMLSEQPMSESQLIFLFLFILRQDDIDAIHKRW